MSDHHSRKTHPIGEDTCACRSDTAQDVEDGVPLANVVASVPGREQVDTRREEPGFEETQYNTKSSESLPVISETHADHDSAPSHDDERQKVPRPKLTADDGRGGLEGDIGGKEDEGNDTVTVDGAAGHELGQIEFHIHANCLSVPKIRLGKRTEYTQQGLQQTDWYDPSN